MRTIYFDMDGTIANFYGVENWLDDLIASNPRPYREAKPLVRMNALAKRLNNLQKMGYKIGIVSWLAKNSTTEFDEVVTETKIEWLHTHLRSVQFDEINIVKYGTPKGTVVQNANGILFDDEEPNRTNWSGEAYAENMIIEVLEMLKNEAV